MAESVMLLKLKAKAQTVTCNCCLQEVSQVRLFSCKCNHVMCTGCAEEWKQRNPRNKLKCSHCNQEESTEQGRGILYVGSIRCQECDQLKQSEDIVWCKECSLLICFKCDHPSKKKHGLKGHAVEAWNKLAPVRDCLSTLTKATAEAEKREEHNAKVLADTLVKVEAGLRQRLSSGFSGLQDALQTLAVLYECLPSVEASSCCVEGSLKTAMVALHLANITTNPLEFKQPPVMRSPSERKIQQLVEKFCEILTSSSTETSKAEALTVSTTSEALAEIAPGLRPSAPLAFSTKTAAKTEVKQYLQQVTMSNQTGLRLQPSAPPLSAITLSPPAVQPLVLTTISSTTTSPPAVQFSPPVSVDATNRTDLPLLQVEAQSKWTANTLVAGSHYDHCVRPTNPLIFLSRDNQVLSINFKADGTTNVKKEGRIELTSDNLRVVGVISVLSNKETFAVSPVAFSPTEIVVNISESYYVGVRRIKTKKSISECHVTNYWSSSERVVVAKHHDRSSTIYYIDPKHRNRDTQETFPGMIGPVENFDDGFFCFFNHDTRSIAIREFDRRTNVSHTTATVNALPYSDLNSLLYGVLTHEIVGKNDQFIVVIKYKGRGRVGTTRVGVLPEQFKNADLIYNGFDKFYLAQKSGPELSLHEFHLP